MPAGDEPSEWCQPMDLMAQNNSVQIAVDLIKLNSHIPALHIPILCRSLPSVMSHNRQKFFTIADAVAN